MGKRAVNEIVRSHNRASSRTHSQSPKEVITNRISPNDSEVAPPRTENTRDCIEMDRRGEKPAFFWLLRALNATWLTSARPPATIFLSLFLFFSEVTTSERPKNRSIPRFKRKSVQEKSRHARCLAGKRTGAAETGVFRLSPAEFSH